MKVTEQDSVRLVLSTTEMFSVVGWVATSLPVMEKPTSVGGTRPQGSKVLS